MNIRALSVSEVSARTGFPRTKVVRLVHAGKLVAHREGERGRLWILESSLDAFFAGVQPTPQAPRRPHFNDVDLAVLPDGPLRFQ